MSKLFCAHCGNRTLKKIAVTVSADGNTQMHFSKNPKVLNSKGLRVRLTHTHTHTDTQTHRHTHTHTHRHRHEHL